MNRYWARRRANAVALARLDQMIQELTIQQADIGRRITRLENQCPNRTPWVTP